jgi:hypothetical protein
MSRHYPASMLVTDRKNTERAIADCGHVYHHTLPRHHLVPAELFEMI